MMRNDHIDFECSIPMSTRCVVEMIFVFKAAAIWRTNFCSKMYVQTGFVISTEKPPKIFSYV